MIRRIPENYSDNCHLCGDFGQLGWIDEALNLYVCEECKDNLVMTEDLLKQAGFDPRHVFIKP